MIRPRLPFFKTNRYRLLHRIALVNGVVLVLSLIIYFFVSMQMVKPAYSEDVLVCLRVCAAGDPCAGTVCAYQPGVTTQAVTGISTTSAVGHGTVTSDGGDSVTERGVVAGTVSGPTTSNLKFEAASAGTGSFSASLTGLSQSTTYYVRAYAINSIGTTYGPEVTFTTSATQGQQDQTPGSSTGGGSGNQDTKPKKKLQDFLIRSHPIQDRAVVETSSIYNYDTGEEFIVDRNQHPKISFKRPTFYGRTNIANAMILITVSSETHYGTKLPDAEGYWRWTATVPLEEGEHTIVVTSVSIDDTSVNATETFSFSVEQVPVTPQKTAPSEPAPKGEVLPAPSETPPASQGGGGTPETQDSTSLFEPFPFAANTSVSSNPDEIAQTGTISIKTEIINTNPDIPKEALLTFRIYTNEGNKVYAEQKTINVIDRVVEYSRAATAEPLSPGRYLVEVEIEYKNARITTTEIFDVGAYQVLGIPLTTIRLDDVQKGIRTVALVLSASFAIFLILLRNEYVRVRKNPFAVSDDDLFHSGMIR